MARNRKPVDEPAPLPTAAPELTQELAAVSLAILDKEDARRTSAQEFNVALKKLKKRQREIANEIKAGGTQLTMMFGGASSSEEIETEH